MNPDKWIKQTISIAAIFSFRMLGLFMLIPVFTLYAHQLSGATPLLTGIALGCYGFSQGLLQIPFGLLSDRYGRKPLLLIGLGLFTIGSLIGALTHSITGMILARTLQGGGAIGSVLMALLADTTADQHRTKAMAVIGLTIGISFSLAMILSPIISASFGLTGIFMLTTLLALIGMLLVFLSPSPPPLQFDSEQKMDIVRFKHVLRNPHLFRINIGIFLQHLILTTTFFAIPTLLQPMLQNCHLNNSGIFYFPLLILGFIFMIPLLFLAERKQRLKTIFILCVTLIIFAQALLALNHHSFKMMSASLLIYFIVFNTLEALLPSLASRQAEAGYRGSAMGIYSSCQFLGIFVGGSLSGLLFSVWGYQSIFILNVILTCIWLAISANMQPLSYCYAITIPLPNTTISPTQLQQKLSTIPGVKNISVNIETQQIYLNVEKISYKTGSAELVISQYTQDT